MIRPVRKPATTPVSAQVEVKHACDHVVLHNRPKNPEHLKAFMENKGKKNCKACNLAKQEQEKQAAKAKRNSPERLRSHKLPDRLPHGSAFQVTYDALTQKWSGGLSIPKENGTCTFTGEASGVFRLLAILDKLYRESPLLEKDTPR